MPGDNEIENNAVATVESEAPAVSEASSTPAETSSAADSSGEQSKETLLDAVLKATETSSKDGEKGPEDKEDAPTSEAEEEEKSEDVAREAAKDDAPDDDEPLPDDVSNKVKKKVRKLLDERRVLRTEVEALRPNADVGHQFSQFAQANNLSPTDVVEALNLAAALKNGDLPRFYEMVSPAVRLAQEQLGLVLPPDLQQRVEQGQMTVDAAREFAKVRYNQQVYAQQAQQMQEASQTHAVRAVQADVQRAVSSFEQRLIATDPDYKAIAEPVRRAAQALLFERGGKVSNANEAVEITKRAYDEVKSQYRRMQAPPKATAKTPTGSNPQTSGARPTPKTLMEAVQQAVQR